MLTPLLLAGAAVGGLAAHGVYHRNSPVFGRVLRGAPSGAVALTFDDGPNPRATAAILDVLRAERVTATFFLLGRHVDRWPALARRVADEGHTLGNHGYHHRKLHLRGPAYVRTDIALGAATILAATGRSPKFFRAPHGFRSPWVSGIARELGQQTVGWTLGVWDSARPGAAEIARRAQALRGGGILLLHDGDGYDPEGDRMQTAEALPAIISALRDRGLRFVALS